MRKQFTTRAQLLFTVATALLFVGGSVHAQLWSGVLQSPRAIDWTTAGSAAVASSATWTQCGSTIAAGSSLTTVNNAIASCGANHYVQLGAGTFNFSSSIEFNQHNNVKLVGMGANQTLIVFSNPGSCLGFTCGVDMNSSDLNYVLGPSNISNWTAGYSQGATSITLSALVTGSTPPTVGTTLVLDQTDDTSDTGDVNVCYEPNTETYPCSTNGDNGGFARTNRGQQQLVTVTAISGAGPYTVTITPGLYMPNWASGKTPQAWWASSPVQNEGIENLSLDYTAAEPTQGSGVGLFVFNCSGCWAKGIRSISPGRSHIQIQVGSKITVQDSYFYLTAGHTSTSYGVETAGASAVLMQNNIFQQVTEPMSLTGSCSGCVEGYNFDIDDIYGSSPFNWRMASSLPHAVGIDHVLIEGNQGSGLEGDIIHGSHHFITAFRNTWNGYQPNNGQAPSSNIGPVLILALNRYYNIIGNILGTPAISWGYVTGTNTIYTIGGSESNTYTVPSDSNVGRTLVRWGNYDTATAAVRWCGNSSNPGWSTTCSSTSEIQTTSGGSGTDYPNFVPSSTSLPASFYLSAKPNWWPSAKPWPPTGPDVSGGNLGTCSGGTYAGQWGVGNAQCSGGGSLSTAYSGLAYSIPAMDCYFKTMNGTTDGTGSVLSFNASTCYVTGPISTPSAPQYLFGVVF